MQNVASIKLSTITNRQKAVRKPKRYRKNVQALYLMSSLKKFKTKKRPLINVLGIFQSKGKKAASQYKAAQKILIMKVSPKSIFDKYIDLYINIIFQLSSDQYELHPYNTHAIYEYFQFT